MWQLNATLTEIAREKLLFNNNRTNPLPLESDRRKREELTPMENMLRAALDNTAALLPSSADLDFPSRWEGKRKRDSLCYSEMSDTEHCFNTRVSWNSVTGRTESELAAWKAVSHSFQDLHSRGVCVCVCVCVCLWLVSRAIRFCTEWKSEAESAVGGACCCAVEGLLYKTRRMSDLQSYEAFPTLYRWCGSTDYSRRFSLNKTASRDHSSLQRRWAYSYFLYSVWPISFLQMLKALCGTETTREGQGKQERRGWFRKHLFPKAGVIRVLTLGKSKRTRLNPSCPLRSLTSQVLRRIRQRASIMHLKTMKCNPFCLIASLEDLDMFNRPEERVRLHWHGALQYLNSLSTLNTNVINHTLNCCNRLG